MGIDLSGEHEGGCHCGAVRYRTDIPAGAVVRRCNCSICAMKGVLMVDVPLENLEVTKGADGLTLYTFGSHEAKHHFCPRCGIHVFHQTRSDPDKFGLNAATLDGVSPYDFRRGAGLRRRQPSGRFGRVALCGDHAVRSVHRLSANEKGGPGGPPSAIRANEALTS